jgi:AAA family ATP:ADP antiporter
MRPGARSLDPGASQSRQKALRICGLSVLAFLAMLSYSFARPATESLFLEAHTHDRLPVVWLLVAGAAVITVGAFARLLARYELLRLFGSTAGVSGLLLLALLASRNAGAPMVHYALYVWKDIYVVLLVETFYSFANTVFSIRSARWIFGGLGIASALGSITGDFAVGVVAERWSTVVALHVVPPLLFLIWAICIPLSRVAGAHLEVHRDPVPVRLTDTLRLLWRSSYVLLLLVLIMLVQVVVTLIDYQYNQMVEQAFPDTDERTAIIGRVYAAVSGATLVLHALTGPTLHLVGVPAVLLAVPILLCGGTGALVALPRFLVAAVVKVASKCFDYTVFRTAKEILYIPLSYAEKTQGKSFVDVMSYRVAKGGASLVLLVLGALGAGMLAGPLTVLVIAAWLGVTVVTVRRFRTKVSRREEMGR